MVKQQMLALKLLYPKEMLINVSSDIKLTELPIPEIFHFIHLYFIFNSLHNF